MSDYNDGYRGLMSPGNQNWNAFRRGQEAARHDQNMADMARRHHDTMMAGFASTPSPPSYGSGYAGGGYSGTPMTPEQAGLLLKLIFGVLIVGGLSYAGYQGAWAINKSIKERQRVDGERQRDALIAATKPVLERQILAIGDSRVPALIDRYVNQSPCHRTQAAMRFSGDTSVIGCYGIKHVKGHMGWSYFIAEEDFPGPDKSAGSVNLETRVFPFSGANLVAERGGMTGMQQSDTRKFLQGVARVRKAGRAALLTQSNCAVVSTELRLNKAVGEGRSKGRAYAFKELEPRIGCMTAKGFRFEL